MFYEVDFGIVGTHGSCVRRSDDADEPIVYRNFIDFAMQQRCAAELAANVQ